MTTEDNDNIVFHDRNWSPDRVLAEVGKRKPVRLICIFETEDGDISSAVSDMQFADTLMLREILNARIQAYVFSMQRADDEDDTG